MTRRESLILIFWRVSPLPPKPLPFGCVCLSIEMRPADSRLTKESPWREREGVVLLLDSNTPAAQRAREGDFRVCLASGVLQDLIDSVPK